MARLVQAVDWSQTSLGSIGSWPRSPLTTVSICLASNFPINIIWGPENTQIYNDGYRVFFGEGYPRMLGEGYHVAWKSAWPALGQPLEPARMGDQFSGKPADVSTCNGYLQETFFTFPLSHIRDERGSIDGLLHPVTETTPTMLAKRRTRAYELLRTATHISSGRATSSWSEWLGL